MEIQEFKKMYEDAEKNWWYISRRRIITYLLKNIYGGKKGFKVLDIASGCGANYKNYNHFGKLYGIDIAWESIKFCKLNRFNNIVQADVINLPFKSNTFDLVLALDAFEHFKDDKKSMKEIREVLKAGGSLLITVPSFMFLWSPHDEAFHHLRRYTKSELINKLRETGFIIKRISYWCMFLLPLVYIVRKIRKSLRIFQADPRSDFFFMVPKPIEIFFNLIQRFEVLLLKKGLVLPFGVSLICYAKKINELF